ncbi:MAG: AAA family ATPase [Verrucomicrobiae bacterium]
MTASIFTKLERPAAPPEQAPAKPSIFKKLPTAPPSAPLFVDLSPHLDGTAKQERPTVAKILDDLCLWYAGRLNSLQSEPGDGKTNVCMRSSISVLDAGGSVLYIDPEDTPKGFTTRMLILGADPEAIRERVHYLHNPTPEEIQAAQAWARKHKPTLVILDGLAESMAAVGANEDKAQEVLPFFRENLRPFAEAGAAVVVADHVTKSTEGRGQFARGSGAKAGRYDGVSYGLQVGIPYTPHQAGFVKLKIAKDRNGGVGPRGKIIAELHFSPGADGRTITEFREPQDSGSGTFRPTAIMEKIRKHLALFDTASKRSLRELGKSQAVDAAISVMLEEGEIEVSTSGQSHVFSLKKTDQ